MPVRVSWTPSSGCDDGAGGGGFDEREARRISQDPGYDLPALLELIDRGCPPALAARIVAPLDVAPGERARPV